MQQQPATQQPSSSSADMDAAQYVDIAKRAQELRDKAQQLANDELLIMNQAVDLNLLAKQLAEATMRPRPMQPMSALPISLLLPGGISNTTTLHKMQLVHAPGVGSSVQYAASTTAAAADNSPAGDQEPALAVQAAEAAIATVTDAAAAGAAAVAQQPASANPQQQQNQQQCQHLAQVAQEPAKVAAALQQPHRGASIGGSGGQGSLETAEEEAVDMDAD